MVNVRKMPMGEEVIRIVIGSESIVRKEIQAPAKLSRSWYAFLEEQGIKLTPEDGVCVKTVGGTGPARTADLGEPVGDFIRKYARRRMVYNVQLVAKKVRRSTSSGRIRGGAPPERLLRTPGTASGPQVVLPLSGGGPVASSSGTGLYLKPRYTPQGGKSSGNYGTRLRTLERQQETEAVAGPLSLVKVEVPSSEGEDDDSQSFIAPRIFSVRSLAWSEPPPELEIEDEETSSGNPSDASNLEAEEDRDGDENDSVVVGRLFPVT